ncbi:hypothetical protein AMS68_000522 [Peltaster fructicola]|uniref:C2H2-type domain-containing protein n=1 Tax=Peltaster fructicola TaxID=286661 RepID=A0A6H0XK58_9PEZI|nr:hypothetical protein AMS68_000522 [Peltaster fructicola]
MTIRNRDRSFSFSEKFSLHEIDLSLAHTLDVDVWRHQIDATIDQGYLTPPESSSDSSFSDIMSCLSWGQDHSDDAWIQDPVDNVTVLPAHTGWPEAVFRSTGPMLPQDYSTWQPGTVNEAMSPAQSFVSQSARTLNTISEAETLPQLPNEMSFLSGDYGCYHGRTMPYGSNMPDVTFVDLSRTVSRSRGSSLPGRTTNMPTRTVRARPAVDTTAPAYMPPETTFTYMDRSTSLPGRTVVLDPVADDFTAFIDMSAQVPVAPETRTTPWNGLDLAGERTVPVIVKTTPSLSNHTEPDEGRHRTDPLYNQEPAADGLYHCPFEGKESCNHAPNKLKCNYDKFIDSHLKPFRCKIEACSKQVFSSTACLLRHEREAHGMHGHGKCPYLCEYPGCERSDPDRGFPRLYNLRDHMKRVHGWKEANEQTAQASKRTGRKRKSSSNKAGPSQRRKPSTVETSDVVGFDDFPEALWTGTYDAGPSGSDTYGYSHF